MVVDSHIVSKRDHIVAIVNFIRLCIKIFNFRPDLLKQFLTVLNHQ